MSLPWTDDSGLRPDDVFTNCDVPRNLIGCIGYATEQIDESLTASLVSPDVLVQAMGDCNDFIFNDSLDSKISTMMSDCNQVFLFLVFSFLFSFQAVQDLLAAQKTGLDYLQRLILKSKKDFSSNAMLYISEKVGLPHLANPPPGMMVPSIPQSYVDKCMTEMSKISTLSCESQASLFSKV